MKYIIYIALVLIAFTACKSKVVYVPVETVKIEYTDRYLRDSMYLKDSTSVNRFIKGDSVFITKDIFKTEYRDKLRIDTIIKIDSIPTPYPVVETKEINKLTFFQKLQIYGFRLILIGLLIRYRKNIYTIFKKLFF